MNAIKSLVAIVATVAATGAFAQEATPDTWIGNTPSVASRHDVDQQARAAVAAGTILKGEATVERATPSTSSLSRSDVAAQARAALRAGRIGFGEATPT